MSTRSSISLKQPNGKFRSIYCHWDGYIQGGVGETLYLNYKDIKTINKLLDLGDLSVLGEKPEHDPKDWDSYSSDYTRCKTYKDRGENNIDAREFDFVDDVEEYYDWSEYHYFFIDGEWYVAEGKDNHLEKLKDKLVI